MIIYIMPTFTYQSFIITRITLKFKYRGKVIFLHDTFDQLFIDYCSYFNGNQDYFECHEVLEELWKEIAPGHKEHALVGLIQVATSLYHWRRNNLRGACKSMKSAISLLQSEQHSPYVACFNVSQLLTNCEHALDAMNEQQPFKAFYLDISNAALAQLVQVNMERLPKLDENFIMHKHTLRDRSDVIAARLAKLQAK